MIAHNLLYVLAALWAPDAQPPAAASAGEFAEPPVPQLTEAHRRYLTRLVRRTMRDVVLGRDIYEPQYVPAALESMSGEVLVRLYQRGYLLAAGSCGPGPIPQAARDAALSAAQALGDGQSVELDLLNKLLVDMEVAGAATPIPALAGWTQPRAVDQYIEPGVHGMVLIGPRGRQHLCPTDLITSDMVLSDALGKLAEYTHGGPAELGKVRLLRFRTAHWYQELTGDEIVSLNRGMTLVLPEAVSPDGLDRAIEKLARYMVYRQLRSGLFTYQYEPARDAYSDQNNLVRQVGAVVAMAVHARWSGRSASLGAADVGIRFHLQGLTPIAAIDNGAFIATDDGRNKLGVTALLCVALGEHPHAERYADVREKLVNGMLWLQRPSGMFVTAFPPARKIDAQEYFPGEALLAMAVQYGHQPSARILDAFDRAIAFYRGYFREIPSPAIAAWQTQAFAIMARHTRREDYADYVFELADELADKQLNPSNCPWARLHGGIASYQPGRAGVATAAYLEGLADALALARWRGDRGRARRYEKIVRAAARFVMQLQVRPEEAYYMRSPQDAVGGIRTTPSLNLLRIDHCQHAMVALIKAGQVLFPDKD